MATAAAPTRPLFCRSLRASGPGPQPSRCPVVSDLSDVIQTWQVGGACPAAPLLCKLVREPVCGRQCLTAEQQTTIIHAIEAICANPC